MLKVIPQSDVFHVVIDTPPKIRTDPIQQYSPGDILNLRRVYLFFRSDVGKDDFSKMDIPQASLFGRAEILGEVLRMMGKRHLIGEEESVSLRLKDGKLIEQDILSLGELYKSSSMFVEGRNLYGQEPANRYEAKVQGNMYELRSVLTSLGQQRLVRVIDEEVQASRAYLKT